MASVEVTLEASQGVHAAGRDVALEMPDQEPGGGPAYEAAALSGWAFGLQRIRALRGDEELPSVRLASLRIVIARRGVSTEQVAALAAAATYRALGGTISETDSKVPELP